MNIGIQVSLMIYNSDRQGSVRDGGDKEEKPPAVTKRSGRATDEAPAKTTRYFGAPRRERIVEKDGKLILVTE